MLSYTREIQSFTSHKDCPIAIFDDEKTNPQITHFLTIANAKRLMNSLTSNIEKAEQAEADRAKIEQERAEFEAFRAERAERAVPDEAREAA